MHVDPLPIPFIKINNDTKLDKYFIEIKLNKGPT